MKEVSKEELRNIIIENISTFVDDVKFSYYFKHTFNYIVTTDWKSEKGGVSIYFECTPDDMYRAEFLSKMDFSNMLDISNRVMVYSLDENSGEIDKLLFDTVDE